MKCYFITMNRMSDVYQGIQNCHSVVELFLKYKENTEEHKALIEWASKHKTIVHLGVSSFSQLTKILSMLTFDGNTLPWSSFVEEDLNNAVSSIAIVMPEHLCDVMKCYKKYRKDIDISNAAGDYYDIKGPGLTKVTLSLFEYNLVVLLSGLRTV